jgi:hypothetical protein
LYVIELFNKLSNKIFFFDLGGPTDIEDFLEFIEHPETHNDLQGKNLLFSFI